MTDKQIKEEIKQVVTNLGNIEFTVEDELEFCKQVLKRKEQECEEWKAKCKKYVEVNEQKTKYYAELKAENDEFKKIINEAKNSKLDLKSFLVGEAVQNEYEQQLDQLKSENEKLKEELSVIQHNCNREGCRYYDDNTFKVFYECKAQKALQLSANSITTKYCDLLQTLTEIKEIAEKFYYQELGNRDCMNCDDYCFDKILQKISEVEDEN